MSHDLVECEAFLGGTKWISKERLRYRPAVYALVLHEDQLLVVDLPSTGKYGLPGGGVELGESMEAALRREVREETGIEVVIESLAGVTESLFYYDPADLAFHGFLFFYRCSPNTFELCDNAHVEDGEASNPHWVNVESLRAEDFQGHGGMIPKLLSQLKDDAPPVSSSEVIAT